MFARNVVAPTSIERTIINFSSICANGGGIGKTVIGKTCAFSEKKTNFAIQCSNINNFIIEGVASGLR